MIKIGDNISYQGEKFNFDRDAFATLDAMRSYPEAGVPDGFKTYCLEDGKEYRINKSNESDPTTGKWREVVGGGIKDITSLELNNHELEPGLYTTTISGTQILVYVYNASGTITQLKITSTPATRYWSGGRWSDWNITMINQIKENGYFLSKTNGTVDLGKTTKSITQGGQKYTPDSRGNIDLPEQSASLSVVNNLNSDSATDALSAAMGKELKRQIDSVQTSGGGVTIDTGRQENPLDTSVPSTKYMQAEFDRLGQEIDNVMTVDQRITYDKIKSGIKGIGITALGDGVIKINNVEKQLSAGYNELLIDGIFSIESLASDRNILSIDWISTNVDITRLAFNGAELLHRLNISFCVFNSISMQIGTKSLAEINFDTCVFKGISSMRFSICDSLYSAKINAKIKVNTLHSFFMGRSYLLKDLCISNFDTSDCTSLQYAFFRLDKLERLDLSGIDTSKVNNFASAFDGANMQLKDFLAPKPNTCKANISFGQCANLTVDAAYSKPSVDGIIDWLYDYVSAGEETSNVITFHSTVKSKLSQTQTERITNKGWTIA